MGQFRQPGFSIEKSRTSQDWMLHVIRKSAL
jgi:hypothetical protein